jgi:hypothetical protein
MNKLVKIAIIGTGQQETLDLSTGTAVDELNKQLTHEQKERKLLLAAGAWGMYRQAGYVARSLQLSQTPAPAEEKAQCSARMAQLISTFLQGDQQVLLPEALRLLAQFQRRLPHELLPQVLEYGAGHKDVREALVPVLGERGHWLAQFSPAWSWATREQRHAHLKPLADLETLWQERSVRQRAEILAYVRGVESAIARDWLATTWKQDNADARLQFLTLLETNLSALDEAFLEKALDDRSEKVRTQAAAMLRLIPTSAYNQRMLERAEGCLQYSDKVWQVSKPAQLDSQWRHDGLTKESELTAKPRLWPAQVMHILAHVPPAHWDARFSVSPAAMIKGISKAKDITDDWRRAVIEAWSDAACQYQAVAWFEPLLDWWSKHREHDHDSYRKLLKHLPQERAEQIILSSLFKGKGADWLDDLEILPRPWSSAFSKECVKILQENAALLAKNNDYTYYYKATQLLNMLVTALPSDCFEIAVTGWNFVTQTETGKKAKQNDWLVNHWNEQIKTLETLLQRRTELTKEIVQ